MSSPRRLAAGQTIKSNSTGMENYKKYYIPEVEIKHYNSIINGQWTKLFQSSSKNNLRTYKNIRKIATSQGDDYKTGCLLDYVYFENNYKMITIDLTKQ